jgi:Zn-dependent protease
MNDNRNEKLRSDINEESWISRYSLFVGRVDGVPVYINFSSAFIFILIAWTLSSTILPNNYPGLVQSTYIIIGIVCALISLVSILLHEVGHSIIASNYGIKFQKIILFALGGIALTPNEITVPKKEIRMAFAGPLISFIISGLSLLLYFIFIQSHMLISQNFPFDAVFFYSGIINLVIGLFNLLPIFPCDGGRILRSFLSYYTHDHFKATIAAIRIGMIISICILVIGVAIGSKYSFVGGIWLMLVAFFLMRGSRLYYNHYQDLFSRN